jgi:hypothetical protein
MSRHDGTAPVTLAQLLHAQVIDDDGRHLGHVHDVRVVRDTDPAEADQAPGYRVEGLIVSRNGLRARLGLTRARRPEPLRPGQPLLWDDVIALQPGCVIVRAGLDSH